jgi:hypothetical protein
VTEDHRGGFQVRAFFVHENRVYTESLTVDVPWSQHDLALKFETMRSKLEPGAKETWSVIVEGGGKKAVEMLATLYDASLDAFLPHHWLQSLSGPFYHDHSRANLQSVGGMLSFQQWEERWNPSTSPRNPTYRHFANGVLMLEFERRDATVWGDGNDFGGAWGNGFGGGGIRTWSVMRKARGAALMESDHAQYGCRRGPGGIRRDRPIRRRAPACASWRTGGFPRPFPGLRPQEPPGNRVLRTPSHHR